jgi:hypothetical protein
VISIITPTRNPTSARFNRAAESQKRHEGSRGAFNGPSKGNRRVVPGCRTHTRRQLPPEVPSCSVALAEPEQAFGVWSGRETEVSPLENDSAAARHEPRAQETLEPLRSSSQQWGSRSGRAFFPRRLGVKPSLPGIAKVARMLEVEHPHHAREKNGYMKMPPCVP